MTITLSPMQLALIAFAGGILLAGAVFFVAGSGGGAGNNPILVTPTVGVSAIGLSTSDAPPTATVPPAPTVAPTVQPDPPTPIPIIRSCAEIRASGAYLNDAERAFFLSSCQTASSGGSSGGSGPSTAPPVSGSSAAPSAAAIEEERAYRVRASATTLDYFTRYSVFWNTASRGLRSDVLEFGGLAGGWANQMNNFKPVPARFLQAHNQLQAALRAEEQHCRLIENVTTQAQYDAWYARFLQLVGATNMAIDDYFLVVGLPR